MANLFDLTGKVALVTGGARSIGLAIGIGLGRAGATVCFNCTGEKSLREALKAYEEAGVPARGFVADVAREAAVKEMVAEIEGQVGTVDILVNNAGINRKAPLAEMEVEDFTQVLSVDLVGPFIVSKAVLPGMLAKGHGKIINVCSMMSEVGRDTVAAYASAKGGLKMLTRNICTEYGGANIQCNGLGPGYIATELTSSLREVQADGTPNPFDRFIRRRTPAGRWGSPEDLVGPAVFLASEASDFVNGQVLYVDGGILASLGK